MVVNPEALITEATSSDGLHNITLEADFSVNEYFNYFKIGRLVVVNVGGLKTTNPASAILVTQNIPVQRSRAIGCLMNDTSNDNALLYGAVNSNRIWIAVHNTSVPYFGQFVYLTD